MKYLILMISLVISVSAFGENSNEDDGQFFVKLYPSLGAGVKPMADGSPLYGTVKVFPLQYGLEEIGFSLFGVGYSFGDKNSVSFSPLGLRALNWMVSMDIHQNRADSVGLSLNYYIPLNFP